MKFSARKISTAVAAVLQAAGMSSHAQASVTYTFTNTEVNAFGSGPFGTVKLTQTGANMAVSVVLAPNFNFVNTGNHSIFSFNSIGVAASDISNILFNGLPDSKVTVVAPGTNPPFGKTFTFMLDCTANGCANGAPGQHDDPLTFTIANAGYADFGIMGTAKAFFAADVICSFNGCNGRTGAVGVVNAGVDDGGGGPSGDPLPEPVSISLFALGLAGLAAARRRR